MKTYTMREFNGTDTIQVIAPDLAAAYKTACVLMDVPVYVGEKA